MSIQKRLLLLTLGLVVPLTLVGLYDQWVAWDSSRQLLNSSIEQQAKLAATAFEQWVEAQSQTLLTVSHVAEAESAGANTLRDYLNSIIKTHPTWLGIEIVDPAGKIVVSQTLKKWNFESGPFEKLKSEAEERRSLVVVVTEQLPDSQLRLLSMAMPLPDGNFVVAQIDGTSASEVFHQLQLPENQIIAVFDENNQLIYRSRRVSPELLSMDVSQTPFFKALSGDRTGIIEVGSPYDSIRRIYGLARVESVDAVVAVGIPQADLYDPARAQFDQQMVLSLMIAGLAFMAAFFLARSIVEPLRKLTKAAKSLGEGNLAVRSGVNDNPVVKDLGRSFDRMVEQIAAREEKLRELDQLKSDFVSSVSHELRTPLTTIKTLVRVLETNTVSRQQHLDYLQIIGSECNRQIELVQNLLDLSRLESGAYRPVIGRTEAAGILSDLVAVHQSAASARMMKLRIVLPEEPLPAIKADPSAFRRIISSLIENAFKYTPDFGEVSIRAGRHDGDVVVEISDTGCGIANEDLSRVFEKFYRGRPLSASPLSFRGVVDEGKDSCLADNETPGIGLGLYLAKSLTEQMSGTIRLKSPAPNGRGSVFVISFPIYGDGEDPSAVSDLVN